MFHSKVINDLMFITELFAFQLHVFSYDQTKCEISGSFLQENTITVEPVYIEHLRVMKKFNVRRCSMYPGSE